MIKFKTKDGKQTIEARDEVQAAAFLGAGLEFASKADKEALKKLQSKEAEKQEE